MRAIRALLAALFVVGFLPLTAHAAPPPQGLAPVQTNTGWSSGPTFTASLKRNPTPGNSILVVVGLDNGDQVGELDADDTANVIHVAESAAAYQVAGAPYVIVFAANVASGVKSWGFHGTSQPHTWLVAEVAGLQKFSPSGVPIWDGPSQGSRVMVRTGETQFDSGHNQATAVPHELVLAAFATRVASGTPPTGTFSNTFPQPGTWTRMGSTVATSTTGPNHRLDVAFKDATESNFYDCLITWNASPFSAASLLIGFYAN